MALIFALALPACGAKTKADARLVSAQFPVDLAPDLTTRVYSPRNDSSADIYLTDLDQQALTRALADPADPTTGTIVHLHMFVRPRPGKTPIDATALSATVRYLVLARGQAGVYDGGGFLLPEGTPGRETFSASVPSATVRLAALTPAFVDRVGRGDLRIRFKAERDEPTADLIARVADRFAARAIATTDEDPLAP